jgi:hypothetical protein
MLSLNIVTLFALFGNHLIAIITCNVIWDYQTGTGQDDLAWAVATDRSGYVYFAGQTCGSLYGTNSGGCDIFVSKMYGSSGDLLWGFQIGTSENDGAYSVAVDNNGDIFSGGYTFQSLYGTYFGEYDIYINKLDGSSGELIWGYQTGTSTGDLASGICVDIRGDVFTVGRTSGSLYGPFKGGFCDIVVSKVNGSSGDLIWGYQTGTASTDDAYSICVDSVGNVFIAGYSEGSLDGVNSGSGDIYISKLDGSSGELIWAYQTGTKNEDCAYGIAVDSNGDVVVTGSTDGSLYVDSTGQSDIFILKLDGTSGAFVWGYQTGTPYVDSAASICVDGADNVFITGSTCGSMYGELNGGKDIIVSKHDSSTGDLIWGYQAGTDFYDLGLGVALDATGNVVMAGESYGSLYGASYGGADIVTCKLGGESPSASPSISLHPTSPSAVPSLSPTAWAYVVSPDMHDIWTMGNTYTIEWTLGGQQEQVAISLLLDSQLLFNITGQEPLDEGVSTYSWNIPSTLTESKSYVVEIQMWKQTHFAYSANFTITIASEKQKSNNFPGAFFAGAIYSFSFVGCVLLSVMCAWVLYFPFIRFRKWIVWTILKCINLSVLLLGWKLLLPSVRDCHGLIISSLAIQSLQIFGVCMVALTTWYDNYTHFLLFCIALDAIISLLFGIASFQCGGERRIEQDFVFVLFVILTAGENWLIFKMRLLYRDVGLLSIDKLLEEQYAHEEEYAKPAPTEGGETKPHEVKKYAPTKTEKKLSATKSAPKRDNILSQPEGQPVSSTSRRMPFNDQMQIALNSEAEALAHVEYVALLSVSGPYTPPLSCREHMLADLPAVMRDVPMLRHIVAECELISSDRLKRLPTGETRLSADEAFALAAYTFDVGFNSTTGEGNDNFYVVLNRLLRERDGATVRALRPYLYFLMKGLTSLPAYSGQVLRGVPSEHLGLIKATYRAFCDVHWSSFTSTTTSLSKAKSFAKAQGGIIFRINVLSGRSIRAYSALPREDEILLGPNSNFLVTSECLMDVDGYYYVTLQERNIEGVTF